MNSIDYKYVMLLQNQLLRYKIKQTHPFKANCRCPICLDSQKSKTKARGWILEKDSDTTMFYCFNCSTGMSLRNLIKNLNATLYHDYCIERGMSKFQQQDDVVEYDFKIPKFKKKGSIFSGIKKISQLPDHHSARKYILSRKIPFKQHHRMYYVPKFVEWTNSLIPNKLSNMKEHSRIVLPLLDHDKQCFGYSGRSVSSSQLRYITIMLDEEKDKVFGLEQVDFQSKYYIVEGPIDSLFIPNSIAMVGASIYSQYINENGVVIFDNEPRNLQTVKKIKNTIDSGAAVCIWPETPGKDINEMVLSGWSIDHIMQVVDDHTYRGLRAEIEFANWKKT